jgi:predicted dehydrogenase
LLGQIDAAVIATPTQYHHAVALELLAEGVHLLVEKPIAPTHAEASDLVDAAREQRLVLQVGHVERFNPAWNTLLPHVREPKYIEAVRRGPFSFRSTDIGVVLDLMIHDLDLVLSLVQSRVQSVDALGVALFGKHEDIAQARLTFENGCVVNLSASRASHTPARTMHVWTPRTMASVDFTTRVCSIVRPSDQLLHRDLQLDDLAPEERATLKDRFMNEHLPVELLESAPADAITAELADFADSIRQGRQPRVSGQQGRDAVAVAEQILGSIARHSWDGVPGGLTGPLVTPQPSVIPAPHFLGRGARVPAERRAG